MTKLVEMNEVNQAGIEPIALYDEVTILIVF